MDRGIPHIQGNQMWWLRYSLNTSSLGLTCHRQPKWAAVQISLPGSSSVCPKPSASPGNPTSPTAHNPWGKVERVNRLIKQQLTKLSTKLRLSWPSLIPIVLTCLWATPCSPRGLRSFELLYGRPKPLHWQGIYPTFPYGPFSVHMLTTISLPPYQQTQLLLSLPHSPQVTGYFSSSYQPSL